MRTVVKFQDTFNDLQSHADQAFSPGQVATFYKEFRNNKDIPKGFAWDQKTPKKIEDKYSLRGFQFGNWVTNEDRFNYLASFYICLNDLQMVMKFKNNNLGLNGSLGIALGSRGVANAKAHYEPSNNVINISRYFREDVLKKKIEEAGMRPPLHIPKKLRFFETGGIGSFAHEYGHFLDYNMGIHIEPSKSAGFLSGPSGSVSRKRIQYPREQVMRNLFEDLFQAVFFENSKESKFNIRLKETKSDYLNNRQEVFARIFEHYVHYKLLTKYGVKNDFMTKKKYSAVVYLTERELLKVIPILDKIVVQFRKNS